MPALYVVAGPNGVGKSTLFNSIIPEGVDYINADLIVKSLRERSGGNNIQDIANQEVSSLFYSKIKNRETFALETNLADVETYKSFIAVQSLDYEVYVFFLCAEPLEICIERVIQRVTLGGHNVYPNIIRERYETGLKLLKHYKSFPDRLVLLDNSTGQLELQAEIHRGNVHFQNEKISTWAAEVITQESVKTESVSSIEEIRKNYKPKS